MRVLRKPYSRFRQNRIQPFETLNTVFQVDLMRIHVLGREYDALRSAESFLQMAKAERLGLRVYKV